MNKIDEQGYKDGGAAFNKGKSLRSIVEARHAMHQGKHENWREVEDYQESFELGFADALLTKLRNK